MLDDYDSNLEESLRIIEESPAFKSIVAYANKFYKELEQELIEKVTEILHEFSNKHQNIGGPVDTEPYAKRIVEIFRGVELI